MFETLIVIGLACVIAAAVGGGLKLKGVEIPVVSSLARQALLAGIGVAVIVGGFIFVRDEAAPNGGTDGFPNGGVVIPGGTAEITLSQSSGPPGTSLTVSGTGFASGETVRIDLHVTELAKVTADTEGSFSDVAVTIPEDWQFEGQFDIRATGDSSIASAREPFEVTS